MSQQCFLAIDIGGTKIAAGLIDPDDPAVVLDHSTRPTCAMGGRDAIVAALLSAVDDLKRAAVARGLTPVAVGIGSPGVVDPDTCVVLSCGNTMPGWGGTNLREIIGQATGLPVGAANDVRAMGLGEATYGGGAGIDHLVFFALGTGLGGAIITNGELPRTPHATRGEMPYIFAPTVDGGCDIVENVGAGPGLAATYRRWAGIDDESFTLHEVMDRYHAGDKLAKKCLDQSMLCTGRALAGFVNAVDTDAIILGGGVISIGDPIVTPLIAGFRQHLLPGLQDIDITQATLGTAAQLVGAGVLAAAALHGH